MVENWNIIEWASGIFISLLIWRERNLSTKFSGLNKGLNSIRENEIKEVHEKIDATRKDVNDKLEKEKEDRLRTCVNIESCERHKSEQRQDKQRLEDSMKEGFREVKKDMAQMNQNIATLTEVVLKSVSKHD